jgi:selenocysteine-specific elongation factor
MKHLIVGTAGHIDHGKSALVKALTDIDPDRLKEEKERGLTIDLGFAYFDLPDSTRVAFVDVPGHERFVKNMLAGAAGMDIVILVVDATESVMPQTREHLDIMKLLAVPRGIVAITKIDLSDGEMIEIVEEEIKDLVEDTFLEDAPIVRVSSKTGEGLDRIRELIAGAVQEQQQKNEDGLFRFPIDRVFTMKGFGTVVTGTVFSGRLTEDEPVTILPKGLHSRARQLQSHNVKQGQISAGMRGSLNLTNVAVQDVNRGDTLVREGTAEPTRLIEAKVQLLPSAPRALKKTSTIKLYAATSQRPARMTLIDRPKLEPGDHCYARLRLSEPLCIFRGDRIVIRGESPEFTIGGGVVLDVVPVKTKGKADERVRWLQMLEKATPQEAAVAFLHQNSLGTKLALLARRTGEPVDFLQKIIADQKSNGEALSVDVGDDSIVISRASFDNLKEKLMSAMKAFFDSQSHRLYMPREELRSRLGAELAPQLFEVLLQGLIEDGMLESSGEGVSLSGHTAQISPKQQQAKDKVENIFRDAACSPPTFSQVEEQVEDARTAKNMISLLVEEGTLTKISPTLAYHRDHLAPAIDKIRNHFEDSDKLAVGDLKTLLGVSRKHAVPLLEYFDRIGLTLRVGDHRVLKEKFRK